MIRRAAVLAFVSILGGCVFDATGVDEVNPVAGEWSYQSSQLNPIPTSVTGTMILSGARAISIEGEFSGVEQEASGGAVQVVATLSGRVVSGTTLDLVMMRAGEDRRHIGTIRGDSIIGTWSTIEVPVVSGEFRMWRP